MSDDLNQYLKNIAEELIIKSGLKLSLVIEEIPGDLQAGYNKIDEIISVNLRKIIINSKLEQVDVNDYLEIVMCHELGHAKDPELSIEVLNRIAYTREKIYEKLDEIDELRESNQNHESLKRELNGMVDALKNLEYFAEERACTLGIMYVPEHLIELYNKHSKITLDTYKNNYDALKNY